MRTTVKQIQTTWGTYWHRLLVIVAAAIMVVPLAFSPLALADDGVDIKSNLCAGADLTAPPTSATVGTEECEDGGGRLQSLIRTALQILFWVAGVAAVFALVIAAIRYILSGGSSSGVTGAKNMIIYALIGLVIAATAQIIVQFVLKSATDSTTVEPPTPTAQVETIDIAAKTDR